MKILITGATGFIGASLIRHFSNIGHEIIALGKNKQPPKRLGNYAEYICIDISHPIKKLICDVVIHTAAIADDHTTYPILEKTNVLGTKHIYEATPDAHLFVHISSASVYNTNHKIHEENEWVDESRLTAYGRSKLQAEKYLVSVYEKNKPIVILRPRAVYGIGDRVLLPRILKLPKKGRVFFPGREDVAASMTHIDNLIQAILMVVKKQPSGFSIYNVADKPIYQLKSVIKEIINTSFENSISYHDVPIPIIKSLLFFVRPLDIRSNLSKQSLEYFAKPNILHIENIQKELGFEPTTNFEKEKDKLFEWIKKIGIDRIIENQKELPWAE